MSEDSPSHPMFGDDMEEILESFVVEGQEIFEQLDQDLLALEDDPENEELLNRIFRGVHTVKGTAGFIGFEPMMDLTHSFEEVLNKLRSGEIAYHPAMIDVMLEAFDWMQVLLDQVIDRNLEEVDMDSTLERLESILNGGFADGESSESKEAKGEEASSGSPESRSTSSPEDGDERSGSRPASSGLRTGSDSTIRVDVDRLDRLMNLVGELVLGRNRLTEISERSAQSASQAEIDHSLTDLSAQIDRITTELQATVMETRMVEIDRVFRRFPRVVRDLSREFDKEIELVTRGEDTELDKSIVEEIGDPLVHLVRNAVDHGIEDPDEREASDKPRQGTIRLEARHEGNHITVEIADDGSGMDPGAILDTAVERGILGEDEADELSTSEVYQLIFEPGFSTTEEVSSVSGRGVGMDVVKTVVNRLNGSLNVESTVGEGTTFRLKVPLTLAILDGLVVAVGTEQFVLPLHAIDEIVPVRDGNERSVNGRRVLRIRDEVIPLVSLKDLLNVEAEETGLRRSHAVVLESDQTTFALEVSGLVGQQEIVIKPLGPVLEATSGVSGATISGDGRAIMILDPPELYRLARRSGAVDALTARESA